MEKGDISNEVPRRFLLVFEGFLGFPPPEPEPEMAPGRWKIFGGKAKRSGPDAWLEWAHSWTINERLAMHIWDAARRYNYTIEVITFLGQNFADVIEEMIDEEQLPVSRVTAHDKHLLVRELAYRPDVVGVFHANGADTFLYGGKGYLRDPDHPALLGSI